MRKFEKGDHVAYNVRWLRSIGCQSGELPFLRGTVSGIKSLGERELIEVNWNDGSSVHVISENLAHVGPNTGFCNC